MARRTPAPAAKAAPARDPKATSRKGSEPSADPSAAAKSSLGLAEAVLITSTVMLIAAILMTDYYLGHHLGSGVFFKT